MADARNGEVDEAAYARARTVVLGAVILVAAGLGVAGSASRQLGGALVLVGWALALLGLHRLGRAGTPS